MSEQNLPSKKNESLLDKIRELISIAFRGKLKEGQAHPFPELIPFEKILDKGIRAKTNPNASLPIKLINEDSWEYLKKKYPQLRLPLNHPLHSGYARNKAKIERAMGIIAAGDKVSLDEHEEALFRAFVTITEDEANQIIRPTIIQTTIAGFKFHDFKKREVKEMLETDPYQLLVLEREPDNKFDVDATKIIWDGYFLGYVPSRYSRVVAKAISEEKRCGCILKDYNNSGRIEDRTTIQIRIDHALTI